MKTHPWRLCAAAFVVWFAGCSPSKVPVSGKLEWPDGKPAVELADGQVIFESPETRTSARGVITKEGAFNINTVSTNDGILPGSYQVAIVEHRPAPEGSTKLPPQYLPDKYYTFSSSGLTATVTPGRSDVVLTVERMPAKK